MKVSFVEPSILFIPCMDVFTEASTNASVEDTSLKASSTYAKTSITSTVGDFVKVSSMQYSV